MVSVAHDLSMHTQKYKLDFILSNYCQMAPRVIVPLSERSTEQNVFPMQFRYQSHNVLKKLD